MTEPIPNYQDKVGLQQAIHDAGHGVVKIDGVMHADDAAAVKIIHDNYDERPALKANKRDEIKVEALTRINAVFPAINDMDELQLVAEQWLSIALAARQPTADFQKVIDIYQAAKDGIATVNTMTDVATIKAFNPATDIMWP